MKVTITFENDQEQQQTLDLSNKFGFDSKEAIESILSSNLIDALRSPFLRIARRKDMIAALKKKNK